MFNFYILNCHSTFIRAEPRWHILTRQAEIGHSYTLSRDKTFLRAELRCDVLVPTRRYLFNIKIYAFYFHFKTNNTLVANIKLVNNAICNLFEEIRYELNAIEIEKCKNVGLTTLMKGWVLLNLTQRFIIENSGWINVEEETQTIIDDAGYYFNVSIPLSLIFGFTEDYRKIVVNAKHEFVLMRSRVDINVVTHIYKSKNYRGLRGL